MKKFSLRILPCIAGLIPSILLVNILIKLYPFTGLGRIIAVPLIFLINSGIIITVLTVTIKAELSKKIKFYIWLTTIILTSFICLLLYPQKIGPHVMIQIWKDFIQ